MLKYNYVIFFNNADFYRIPYQDFSTYPGVKSFFGFQPDNHLLANLFHVHTSKKVNAIINLPFKSIWMSRFKKIKFINSKPICFVFMATYLAYDYVRSFVKFLHTEYPYAKFVCYYSDIIKDVTISPTALSELFDLFVSYDIEQARKYNIQYHPTSFSDVTVIDDESIEHCDVYLLAYPKDRLLKVYKIYDQLCDAGIKSSFYLMGVPKVQQRIGINYIRKKMPYYLNLQHVIKSKCLLEVEQGGASGATLRTWEAINFGKGLITNNYGLSQTEFYNPRHVSFISDDNLVDIDFIREYKENTNTKRNLIRPILLLTFLDNIL